MGILDELKKQAEQVRKSREAEANRQIQLEQTYLAELRPRMLGIYRYLLDLVEQIDTIGVVVKAAYDLPVLGHVEPLEHKNYCFHIDNSDKPKRITLDFHCQSKREFLAPVDAQQADAARRFLDSQQIRSIDWPVRNANGDIHQIVFKFVPKIKVMLEFIADVERSAIAIRTLNFEEFGTRNYIISHENIDDAWLDQLGNYLLRRCNNLDVVEEKLQITEEELQQLRDHIAMAQQKLMMELELERTEHALEADGGGSGIRGLVQKLLG